MKRYALEGSVIIIGILFSFYIEEMRIQNKNVEIKNELLLDLNRAIESDIIQINNVRELLNKSQAEISEIQSDIKTNHQQISDLEAIKKLLAINVSISFFPQEGVFTELVSSGSFELIKNKELKSKLLEIYNHQKERNYSISDDIDVLMKDYTQAIMTNFRIGINYSPFDGEIYGTLIMEDYVFDSEYYLSNEFYGFNSTLKIFGFLYSRLLNDIKKSHEAILLLSLAEIG
ncbi:DUF6090 family protein [Woeseiaceae bacterium]|nr:DUF6090 family protein [Woeseiaceae bacterium]